MSKEFNVVEIRQQAYMLEEIGERREMNRRCLQMLLISYLPLEIDREIQVYFTDQGWLKGKVIKGEVGADNNIELNVIQFDSDSEIIQLNYDVETYDWEEFDDWRYVGR